MPAFSKESMSFPQIFPRPSASARRSEFFMWMSLRPERRTLLILGELRWIPLQAVDKGQKSRTRSKQASLFGQDHNLGADTARPPCNAPCQIHDTSILSTRERPRPKGGFPDVISVSQLGWEEIPPYKKDQHHFRAQKSP